MSSLLGPDARPCNCGSGFPSHWEDDARGIPLDRVCPKCREAKLKKYRPEVLTNPHYWTDEPIEPEDSYGAHDPKDI